MKSLSISERYGWAKYVGHQVYYSLIGRDYEWELMPLALDQGVGGAGVVSAGLGTVDGEDSARAAAAGRISLSPLPVQPEPANLAALKTRMLERWPMTSLLDVFKEADLRIRFTDVFRSATAWENVDREVIQERLLLALYGLVRTLASSA